MNNTPRILDIQFTTLFEEEILQLLRNHLTEKKSPPLFIATPNPEILLSCKKNPAFKKILQNTGLNLPDGNGIIWANKYLQKKSWHTSAPIIYLQGIISVITFLFHRKNDKKRFNKAIHGSDITTKICLDPILSSRRIFLLGNAAGLAPNTSLLAGKKLRKLNPNINIAGELDSSPDNPEIIPKINAGKAEILFVAFGAPQQETWLAHNLPHLPSVKIAIGVGGTFDFLAGILPRAPGWMRKIGLEWFYRLLRQPRKRFKRIINAFFVFPKEVIKSRQANPDKHKNADT